MPIFKHPEYPEATLLRLESMVPCRESQVSTLLSIFGERQHFSFPSLFIYGHTSSGKTYVMQTLLKTLELPHVFVNCIECFTSRLLLEDILRQLQHLSSKKEDPPPPPLSCDTFNDFIRLLKQATMSPDLNNQTLYVFCLLGAGSDEQLRLHMRRMGPSQEHAWPNIRKGCANAISAHHLNLAYGGGCSSEPALGKVLDNAEKLREMEANLLPGFLRLQELTERNVTLVLLSEIVWDLLRPNTGCLEPLPLYFPDYSIGHLQKILSHDHPPEYSFDFYAAYINILLGVFYPVCRDLKELRHLAVLNFAKYCEPVVQGEANERDTRQLWKNIESHLKKAMQTVYLREISSSQWERLQQDDGEPGQLKGLSAHAHVELPYYSKFLLIAAYLASYNPARTDKRFFVKHHGKIRKTNFQKKHEKTSNHLLGPKPFPLDRLLAILYSIVDSKVAPNANIFSQITSLVTLQLLTLVGHDDQLNGPRYKCNVSLDFIRGISRTVNFDIIKYLYDFL